MPKRVERHVAPALVLQLEKINCWYCKIQRLNNGVRCSCGAYENLDIAPIKPDKFCRFCTAPRGKREGTTLNCAKCGASPVLMNRVYLAPTQDKVVRKVAVSTSAYGKGNDGPLTVRDVLPQQSQQKRTSSRVPLTEKLDAYFQ